MGQAGQPSAQNNRETGCDGDLSAFRNWANFQHVEELARHWNVDPIRIPQYSADEIRAVTDEAARRGSYVAAHAYSPEAIRHSIDNGVCSIEGTLEITSNPIKIASTKIVSSVSSVGVMRHLLRQLARGSGQGEFLFVSAVAVRTVEHSRADDDGDAAEFVVTRIFR